MSSTTDTIDDIGEGLQDFALDYANSVLSGEEIAGPHVRNACRRYIDDLAKGHERNLRMNLKVAHKVKTFFERKLRLSEGQFDGKPFKLHPSQTFVLFNLFGWQRLSVDHGWVRRFRRAYIEQGKGNGKSPLVGGIGLLGLVADRESGAEIYAAGATKDQAGILFRDAVKMVNQSPELRKRINSSGGEGREYNLAFLPKGSFFRPISREAKRTGSGPRPHMALCDEVHEHPDRGVMEMLERGFKFRRQPLLLMITNSGTDRTSVCWEEHEHAVKVASGNLNARSDDAFYVGDAVDDSTFSYVCALDKGDDPLTDKSCWKKANPLLGVTITEEYLQGVVDQAVSMPGKLNNIMRLHFCTWTDADTAWMTRALLEPCIVDFDPETEHAGKQVYLGADLSQVKDLTSVGYCTQSGVVEHGEHAGKPIYDVWCESWTPKDTLAARVLADKQPYDLWVKSGELTAVNGRSINYRHIAQAIVEATHFYDVQSLAYDRYAFSRMLEPEMHELGLTNLQCVEHPQGGTKKGKPTEAMVEAAKAAKREPEGLWMPMSVRLFEQLLEERRIRIRRNAPLIMAAMSAVTDSDRWGNYWLAKERAANKIDPIIAVCMAVGLAASHEAVVEREFQMFVF